MAWMRAVTGRLESRQVYPVGVVYNTFPLPRNDADLSALDRLAQAVLDARAAPPAAILADLDNPDVTPVDLPRAQQALDRAVDHLCRPRKFASECERVEHLLALYERLRAPLTASGEPQTRRMRVRRVRP
ncbi:MAG: DNA methylase [Acidobacteria bacterium]|nr:DNA methylase [Acidobacteriota bacterium]